MLNDNPQFGTHNQEFPKSKLINNLSDNDKSSISVEKSKLPNLTPKADSDANQE